MSSLHGSQPSGGDNFQSETETRSVGDIVSDISRDMTSLVRQEMELARTEFKQEATRAAKGAGMLGGAGVAGHLMLIFLSFALAYLLDNWMPIELAALIVGLLWAIVAAALVQRGRAEIKKANPELPATQQSLKEDVQWAKAQKS
jgi:uncharacterized membrane protein YqjE